MWQAAELLRHPHLQPYVLKVHLKFNSPRRNSLPGHWPESDYISKTRFLEPDNVPQYTHRQKRQSYSNDRTLNPSISGAEDSLCSTQRKQNTPSHLNRRLAELSFGSTHEKAAISKPVASKTANTARTPGLTPSKASATPKRWTEPKKNRESVRLFGSFAENENLQNACRHICVDRDSIPVTLTTLN